MATRTPEQWGEEFGFARPRVEAFTGLFNHLLTELLDAHEIDVAQIECRTKGVQSFIGKIHRKNEKYVDPLIEITDQCGIRIIAYYPADVERIGSLIDSEFTIDWPNSVRQGTASDPERFGYRSDHYVVQLATGRSDLAEWAAYRDQKAEIQVRTVMQHAWAAVDHKIRYKGKDLPGNLQRRLSRLSALLEIADEQFSAIRRESAEVADEYDRSLTGGDFDLGLDILSLGSFFAASDVLRAWVGRAVGHGYRDGPAIADDAEQYIASVDWGPFLDVLRDVGIESIDALQQRLMEAEGWGEFALERILAGSEEAGFVPMAEPKDVLAFLLLFGAGNLAAVDRTNYVEPLRRGIKGAIRQRKGETTD